MAQRTSPFASWKPTQKHLDFVASSAGNNWRSLLTHLGIDLADIESFKNESLGETKGACFKGLVHWLKGNVPDEPVTFGTLFEALEDANMTGCISKLENRLKAKSSLNRADQDLSTQTNSAANQEAIKQLQVKLVTLEMELKHSKSKEQVKANSVLQEAIKQVQKELEELKVTVAKDSKSDHMKAKEQAKANIENQEVIKQLQKEVEEVRKAEKESKAQPSPVTQDHIKHLESQIQSLLKHQQQLQSDLERVHSRSNPSPMQPIPAGNPRTKPTSSSGQFLAMGCHATRSVRETKYIAAIDFGSTFTKVAYAAKKQPFDLVVKNDWKNSDAMPRKVPTSVLFNGYDQVIAYGYEAEARASSRYEKHALFRHFKMSLHSHSMKFYRPGDMKLTSLDGKTQMYALEVVSKALEYLGLLVRDFIKLRRSGPTPLNIDITWVITVPAIWNISLRQFMRKAVKEAGLCSADFSNLVIALEPECAALYLEHKYPDMRRGRYAIVDCGGGTVDVSYHQCTPSGQSSYTIDELKESTGEPKGGTLADRKFEELIDQVFGRGGTIEKLKKEDVGYYLDLMANFEAKKPCINNGAVKNITYFRFLPSVGKKQKFAGVSIDSKTFEFIRIEDYKFSSLFQEPVDWIRSHLAESLRSVKSVERLYFTGGFSQCKLLQDRVKDLGPTVIMPDEDELSVVKGAVIFANNSRIVRSRVMGMSYGIAFYASSSKYGKYDPVKHKGRAATAVCDNVFSPLICKGDTITDSDEKVSTYKFKDAQNAATFSIYASPDQYVQYTDDPGCELIGSMTLQMPDTGSRSGGKKAVELYTSFTGKELHIRARSEADNTGICCVVRL